jgi:hypothetical protein
LLQFLFLGGLAIAGGGLYYAKENGYLDDYMSQMPSSLSIPAPSKPVEVTLYLEYFA